MKRLALLLLLPLAGGVLFAQTTYSIAGTVPNGTVGVSYSASLQTNPQAYAAWSYTGSLPPGLSMTTGSSYVATISGTPTAAGTYSFTVQAAVGIGQQIFVRQAYTVVIAAAQVSPVSITTSSLPDGVIGVSYSQGVTVAGGYGPGTYTFTVPPLALPSGLQLNTSSGVIYGTPTMAETCNFTLQVTSQSGTNPVLSASAALSINITAPTLTIATGSLPAGGVGLPYSQPLTATGGTPPYTWRLTGSSLPGGLTLASSGNISGTPTAAGSFTFQVTVSDSLQVSAPGTLTIRIVPVALVITTTSLPGGTVGTSYTAPTLAATGGTPPYTWSVASGALPGGLSLGSAGVISGTPAASGSFTFQVTVSDSLQVSASGSLTIRITPAALVITTASLPAGTVGTAYTATTLAATGGTPPYTWSVGSGALPGGLSISSAGVISGTPNATGTFSITLQVTDSAQVTANRAYSVAVAVPAVPLSITTTQASLPNPEVGVAFTQAFAATGGTPPYQWSVSTGTLPTGFTLSSAGILTGTPTAAVTFSFTLQVTDSAKATATKAFTIIAINAVKIMTAPPALDGVTGVSYTMQFGAGGGLGPYTWSIASGSIPSGLSLNTATGLLSGTPTTPGTYTFTIGVTDQNGQKDSVSYSIKIVTAISITTQSPLPGGVVGVAYTQTFAATGGTAPYRWLVSFDFPPPTWLTLSAAGSLTGTPTAAGTFNFPVQVVDSAGQNAVAQFTITVTAALTITTASPLPGATVGNAYNQALALAGGAAPFTWSIASGALPAGIALNPGSLNGIPSAPGTFTFTVSVTGGGQTATQSLTLTVGVPPGPPATITVPSATPAPGTQPALGIGNLSAYPLAITGLVTLTFTPDSPSPDGQEVLFTTGGRTVGFTVAANTTQVVFSGATPGVQVGTVSGTITLTLKLTAAGIDVTPSSVTPTTLKIAKAAPVIKTATVTRTTGGFNLVVVGYATSREMVSAALTFTAAAGVTLSSSSATVSLSSAFTTWYADPTSAAYGSNFSLTMPFTIANGASTAPLTSVSVVLTNAQGSSTSASATY